MSQWNNQTLFDYIIITYMLNEWQSLHADKKIFSYIYIILIAWILAC